MNASLSKLVVETLDTLELILYVAGNSPASLRALHNIKSLCDQHAQGRYRLEIVDVGLDPLRGLVDGVFVTPCLIKQAPDPGVKLVGDLSRADIVLPALGIGCSGTAAEK